MTKRQYSHKVGKDGKPVVVEVTLPRNLRGSSVYDEGTIKDGIGSRILDGVLRKMGK